jgi:hypothetical protein
VRKDREDHNIKQEGIKILSAAKVQENKRRKDKKLHRGRISKTGREKKKDEAEENNSKLQNPFLKIQQFRTLSRNSTELMKPGGSSVRSRQPSKYSLYLAR